MAKISKLGWLIWKNYLFQLLNVHTASDVTQIQMHTAEPLGPDPVLFNGKIATVRVEKVHIARKGSNSGRTHSSRR
jgi:hypothetical protein